MDTTQTIDALQSAIQQREAWHLVIHTVWMLIVFGLLFLLRRYHNFHKKRIDELAVEQGVQRQVTAHLCGIVILENTHVLLRNLTGATRPGKDGDLEYEIRHGEKTSWLADPLGIFKASQNQHKNNPA